jgi:hypothetical protein
MSKIKRICLFAGPNVGKSVAAAWMFAKLKIAGHNADLVQEKAKELAYDGIKIRKYDQLQLFAEQMRREELLLRNGVLVVTDSPIRLGLAYGLKYGFPCVDEMMKVIDSFDADHPPLNIFLKRDEKDVYQQAGRYENREQALEMDGVILGLIGKAPHGYVVCPSHDLEGLLQTVSVALSGDDLARWSELCRLSGAKPVEF